MRELQIGGTRPHNVRYSCSSGKKADIVSGPGIAGSAQQAPGDAAEAPVTPSVI
jgi:hypothetical protein